MRTFFLALVITFVITGAGCRNITTEKDIVVITDNGELPSITVESTSVDAPAPAPTTTSAATHDGSDTLATTAVVKPGVKSIPSGNTTQLVPTEDYTAALAKYGAANGFRLQIVNCGATPGYLTVKAGGRFMVDNRDAKTHKIAIGNSSYTLQKYDFAIVTAKKPGKHQITCDGGGSAVLYINQ